MDLELQGKHIIVTGGNGALGSAVVKTLTDSGAHVTIPIYKGEYPKSESLTVINDVDLRNEQATQAFFREACSSQNNQLWGLVNIAGGFSMSKLADASSDDFSKMFDMNVRTCFHATKAAVHHFRESSGGGSGASAGRVVNVSARAALEPRTGAGMSLYVASKAAVAALTTAWGQELVDLGVLVNAVAPSIIDTPDNRKAMPNADHDNWPTPEQIARTIAFLVSPANRVTRGAIVPVDGKA